MRQGSVRATGNISQSAAGFTKIASGTTAERPSSPVDGMLRYNTTTMMSEFYSNGSWKNVLEISNSEALGRLEIAQLIGVGGIQSDPLLFVRSNPTTALSVATLNFNFTTSGASDRTWLQVDPNIWDASVGYESPFKAAIIGITGSTTTDQTTKSITIYINETPYPNAITFPAGSGLTAFSVTAIPVPLGAKIRARAAGSGKMGAISIQIITKWRL